MRGLDAGVLGLARAGKAEPLTGGRRRIWRSESRSPAQVAAEEALGAVRLRTRRAIALEARSATRDYQSAMGMHGAACASGGRTWRLHCGAGLTRTSRSANSRPCRGRWPDDRGRAATAQRWPPPSRRLGRRRITPTGSTAQSEARTHITIAPEGRRTP